jgi:hypothetical protein
MEFMKAEARPAPGVLSPLCVTNLFVGKFAEAPGICYSGEEQILFRFLEVHQRIDFVTFRAHMELSFVGLRSA